MVDERSAWKSCGPMFEHRSSPLLLPRAFVWRQIRFLGESLLLVVSSLGTGVWGYLYFGE